MVNNLDKLSKCKKDPITYIELEQVINSNRATFIADVLMFVIFVILVLWYFYNTLALGMNKFAMNKFVEKYQGKSYDSATNEYKTYEKLNKQISHLKSTRKNLGTMFISFILADFFRRSANTEEPILKDKCTNVTTSIVYVNTLRVIAGLLAVPILYALMELVQKSIKHYKSLDYNFNVGTVLYISILNFTISNINIRDTIEEFVDPSKSMRNANFLKDFNKELTGKLFTPTFIVFCIYLVLLVVLLIISLYKKDPKIIKRFTSIMNGNVVWVLLQFYIVESLTYPIKNIMNTNNYNAKISDDGGVKTLTISK